ncbi:hypothetical protein [Aeromicrobium duanguangcaii]|uniref:hypothetical protein n=1 Tax=Aeromicrobium duanguangcaii TaxID=2968086 RepID=UPI002017F652|nr:hypothetical protein [Aeromicrobium duanguangcaii]MCL3838025.1 hypothetical protein [Aeromicrobium duanguangcaii]
MNRPYRRLVLAAVSAVAVLGAGALTAPAAQAAGPDAPILTKWANPGVAKLPSGGYVMTHTTSWNKPGAFATAPQPNGPWKRTSTTLLTGTPAWAKSAKQKRTVWAPSIIRGTNGRWVVFYSALVPGRGSQRCIGTGTSTRPTGPFVPDARPLSCFKGSGTKAKDFIANEGTTSLIDATPAVVNGQTVLTYKTSHGYTKKGKKYWHTTIRMVALNPARPNQVIANPVNRNGRSVQLTSKRHRYIEENPSLIHRGGKYVLFTSWGWYGTHDRYWTQSRTNRSLWSGWPTTARRVTFPAGTNTWGQGNGQAIATSPGTWALFWNGQEPGFKRGQGPKHLYVGKLGWKNGHPVVSKVLKRR